MKKTSLPARQTLTPLSGFDIRLSMSYKRSQIDGALHAVLSGPFRTARGRVGRSVPKTFQTRITRLLEIDRAWGIENAHRLDKFGMAFHDAVPAGTGTDIEYSEFNAFALVIALVMVRIGFKQGEVVETLGILRPSLQRAFSRSVAAVQTRGNLRHVTDSAQKLPTYSRRVPARAQESELDPHVFLVLREVEISLEVAARTGSALKTKEGAIDYKLCWGWEDLFQFMQQEIPRETPSVLLIELAELAARIVEVLPLQPLRRRGRQ
jgi:hypothetical protein